MPLSAGTRLGHYDVTALIGQGGMGEVYKARDTKLDRDVALKILLDAFRQISSLLSGMVLWRSSLSNERCSAGLATSCRNKRNRGPRSGASGLPCVGEPSGEALIPSERPAAATPRHAALKGCATPVFPL